MFSSIIISGELAQDHEFIYPFYRLLEEKSNLDGSIELVVTRWDA